MPATLPEYLYRRASYYYVRVVVPERLRSIISMTDLRYSLRTPDLKEARHRSRLIVSFIHSVFRRIETGGSMYQLTDAKIQEMIKAYVNKLLEDDLDYRITRAPVEPAYDPHGRDINSEVDSMLTQELKGHALDQLKRADYSEIQLHVDSMLSGNDTAIDDKDSATYKKLCHYMLRAMIQHYDVLAARANGTAYLENGEQQVSIAGQEPEKTSRELGQLMKDFWEDRSPSWKPRSVTEYQRCKTDLLEFLGEDTQIHTINYDVMKGYRKKLKDSGLGVSRINFYLGFASMVFNHEMKTTGHLSINPADGVKLRDRRRKDQMRDGFTLDHLKALFVDSPEYGQDQFKRPDFFWIPLLSLYTGARLEELCQLHVDQVLDEDGIWVLEIDEKHPRQSVKTSERRLVPLHPFLTTDGLGFHRWMMDQDGPRLWPMLRWYNNRWSHYFGRWFGTFWKSCGIEGKLGFHSFRHTVETELREAEVDGLWINMLTGHSIEGEGGGRYTKRSPKTIYKKAVLQLKWHEKLDFSHLTSSKWARSA